MKDNSSTLSSYFDSPERKSDGEVLHQKEDILQNKMLQEVFDILPDQVIILNSDRQIVAASSKSNDIVKTFVQEDVTSLRLGEAIGCVYSHDLKGGCGTSKYCSTCGAGQAIKITKDTNQDCSKECNVSAEIEGQKINYNFKITTKVFNHKNEKYILVFLKDLADKKRKELLEKIFYHDVLNIATGIEGLSSLLTEIEDKNELEDISQTIQFSIKNLMNEILTQRNITQAENGNLVVEKKQFDLYKLFCEVRGLFNRSDIAAGKTILLDYPQKQKEIVTDPVLLNRSIINLVKNALEATEKGGEILISVEFGKEIVKISIKNDGVIPQETQLQIFQRSFSTKGNNGRGIGTYSVKLLVEQYLKGKVSFISTPETQTIFTIEIPTGI